MYLTRAGLYYIDVWSLRVIQVSGVGVIRDLNVFYGLGFTFLGEQVKEGVIVIVIIAECCHG